MLGKPSVNLTAISAALEKSSAEATYSTGVPKSFDPSFPVFSNPVQSKVLIYFPSYAEEKKSSFLAHPIKDGGSFYYRRCSNVVIPAEAKENFDAIGWDGTCPMCEALKDYWELFNIRKEKFCSENMLDISDKTNEKIKKFNKEFLSDRAIKEPTRFFVYPIVVFESDYKFDETKRYEIPVPKVDTTTNTYVMKPMYLVINETTYTGHIQTATRGESLNGKFMVFEYIVKPGKEGKTPEANKMTCAKDLEVVIKNFLPENDAPAWAQYADQLALGFTPEKAQEVVNTAAIYDMTSLKADTDRIMMEPRRALIQLKNQQSMGGTYAAIPNSVAQNPTLEAFGTPVAQIGQTNVAPTAPASAVAPAPAPAPAPMSVPNVPPMGTPIAPLPPTNN